MKVRINNIECRFIQGRYEIIKWYPNTYYGSEERLISEGYEKVMYPNDRWQMKKDWHNIDMSCFVNPESCYTVATLEYDDDEMCCDMKTVGSRLLDLNSMERGDFFVVYDISEKLIKEENENKEEENKF